MTNVLARVGLSAAVLFLALGLPACDCAGTTTPGLVDAGDVGPRPDGGDGGSGDTGAGDGGDAARPDAGPCTASGPETCDGTDEDCDGSIDEALVQLCGSDVGQCVAGMQTCAGGTFGACVGEVAPAASEACNGLDDNCDGSTDEGCPCTDGTTQSCGGDVGACTPGVQTCASSVWGACVGEIMATAELCNGLDDDCDGMSDELFVDLGGDCDGTDVDLCTEGMRVCASDGTGTVCNDETADSVEACNGTDDDCDGAIDESCGCTDGAMQACGTDVGACTAGVQTCAAGAWGACVGEIAATAELCNAIDDDCDGSTDEPFTLGGACDGADADTCTEGTVVCSAAGGTTCSDATGDSVEICNAMDDNCDGTVDEGFAVGMTCDGADADLCAEGALACNATGGASCSDATGDSVEVCNAMDDNCDGTVDEGFAVGMACDGPDADLCNEGALACDATGGVACSDATADSVEMCNGVDDDCDGNIDEGNPGGGVICAGATDFGTCISRTACVMGAIVCRGTFVSPTGLPTNPGTPAAPLGSITAAIANAGILGGGADVCVCDAASAGASIYTENVTMVEGTSVLGAYDCNTWANTPATRTTQIQDTDDDGLTFPAGITSATALSQMIVVGFDHAGAGVTTSAITVTDSSPTLQTVIGRAGLASTAIALRVVESAGATASPVVTGGTYSAAGTAGGTAVGARLEQSSPRFNMVQLGAGAPGAAAAAARSFGVDCQGCGGTTFTGGGLNGGAATTNAYGLFGTGDLTGLTASATNFSAGLTSAPMSSSFGVRLETCTGAPTFTGSSGFGGSPNVAGSTRTAFYASGAACAPVWDGGRLTGCEAGQTCIGYEGAASSLGILRNATVTGSTAGADSTTAVRCTGNACSTIQFNTISAGAVTRSGPTGIGVELDGASPLVDDNNILGPSGGAAGLLVTAPRWYGVFLRATGATLTNNIVRDGTHAQLVGVVWYEISAPASGGARGPIIHSNTIEYSGCLTCGSRVGLGILGTVGSAPSGTVRNNIIRNVGAGGNTTPVNERGMPSDFAIFENNALFDPTAMAIYLDEGTNLLTTAPAINALLGAAANQVVNCMPNATWHLPAGSACRNTGTNMGAPALDFDGDMRPREAICDIGADEFVP